MKTSQNIRSILGGFFVLILTIVSANHVYAETETSTKPAVANNKSKKSSKSDSKTLPKANTKAQAAEAAKAPGDLANVQILNAAMEFPASVVVNLGKVGLIKFPKPVNRVAIGDPRIADYVVLSPTELYILGKSVGSTNMLVWDGQGVARQITADVDIDLAPLKQSLSLNLPKEQDISVSVSSSSLVLNGTVADTLNAETALSIAEAYARNLNRFATRAASASTLPPGVGTAAPQPVAAQPISLGGGVTVINLMKIRDPQQVMLEVRIAEVSKNVLEKLGFRFSAFSKVDNSASFIQIPGTNITTLEKSTSIETTTTSVAAPIFVANPAGPSYPNKLTSVDPVAGAIQYLLSGNKGRLLDIDAQKTDDLVKILAEPTIVAMSGKSGSFLSGGQIYVPIPTNPGESSKVQLVEFGVNLKFTPVVLDDGRINLQVSPEVSELVSTSPLLLTTRRVSSTVQMRHKETLVIGGLLKNNVKENVKALPLLGEIPILGALFRSSQFVNDKTELVIVVSPSLVKATVEPPKLPTDNFVPPTRSEFFFGGKLEGSTPTTPPGQK